MSRFSGKCDLCDIIEITGGFEEFKGTKLFIGDYNHPLVYDSEKDLIPYYPYIEMMGFHDNKNSKNSVMILSEKSWIDIEEERYGKFSCHDYYRKMLEDELKKVSESE